MNSWNVCHTCGFSIADGVSCVNCGHSRAQPEPADLIEYDFGVPVRNAPRCLDGDVAFEALEHDLQLGLARARGDMFGVDDAP